MLDYFWDAAASLWRIPAYVNCLATYLQHDLPRHYMSSGILKILKKILYLFFSFSHIFPVSYSSYIVEHKYPFVTTPQPHPNITSCLSDELVFGRNIFKWELDVFLRLFALFLISSNSVPILLFKEICFLFLFCWLFVPWCC